MEIQTQLARQAARTISRKAVRDTAKNIDINPMIKHIGTAAIIAGVSYLISSKIK